MSHPGHVTSTFSIVASDPRAQEWGVAVQSKSFNVGESVPWAQAGVGAVATQAWTVKAYGPRALALLRRGHDPKDVLAHLLVNDKGGATRQLALIDAKGHATNFTGNECPPWAGGLAEPNVSVQGNHLAGERVLKNMLRAFHAQEGKLGDRLLRALEAGQKAGGDTRGQQSAALIVAREQSDIDGAGDGYVNLRVDDHVEPIQELRRLYGIWELELYPYLESQRINALLRAKKYARAQRLHRDFAANAERLARKHRDDANLMNTLAWMLAQNALGLDAALKYARRGVRLKPENASIVDTLAEVLYQRGEISQAIKIERALVAAHPDRADLQAQLARFEKGNK